MKRALFLLLVCLWGGQNIRAWDFCQKNLDGMMLYYNRLYLDEWCCEVAYCPNATYDRWRLRIPETVTLPGDASKGTPDTILTVIGIEENAFRLRTTAAERRYNAECSFREVELPSSLSYIGDYAFCGCTMMNKIVWPEDTPWIYLFGDGAFKKSSLMNIRIPKTIEYLGKEAFMYCPGATFEFEEGNRFLTTIPRYCFYGCGMNNIVIPSNIKKIECNAFGNCMGIHAPKLPFGIQILEDSAFYNHRDWTDFEIPSTILDIGNYALCARKVEPDIDHTKRNYLNIKNLYVNKLTPPYCTSWRTFGDSLYDKETRKMSLKISNVCLIIPAGTTEIYTTTWPWTRFNEVNIKTRNTSGIPEAPASEQEEESIFSLEGRKLDFKQKGINIIHYKDGTTKKVWLK